MRTNKLSEINFNEKNMFIIDMTYLLSSTFFFVYSEISFLLVTLSTANNIKVSLTVDVCFSQMKIDVIKVSGCSAVKKMLTFSIKVLTTN